MLFQVCLDVCPIRAGIQILPLTVTVNVVGVHSSLDLFDCFLGLLAGDGLRLVFALVIQHEQCVWVKEVPVLEVLQIFCSSELTVGVEDAIPDRDTFQQNLRSRTPFDDLLG